MVKKTNIKKNIFQTQRKSICVQAQIFSERATQLEKILLKQTIWEIVKFVG